MTDQNKGMYDAETLEYARGVAAIPSGEVSTPTTAALYEALHGKRAMETYARNKAQVALQEKVELVLRSSGHFAAGKLGVFTIDALGRITAIRPVHVTALTNIPRPGPRATGLHQQVAAAMRRLGWLKTPHRLGPVYCAPDGWHK